MYFRFQEKTKLLTVDDSFAHLRTVRPNGDLEFEFVYSVSQRDIVHRQASKVSVSIDSRHIVKKPLLGSTHRGQVDTTALVSNVRTAVIDAKSTIQQRTRYQMASKESDITAHVNNDAIPQLRAKAPTSAIPAFNRPRLALVPVTSVKQNNDPQPILYRITNAAVVPSLQQVLTSSQGEDPRSLMHDMITRQGLDPSYLIELTPRSSSESSERGGLSNTQRALEKTTDPATRLLNLHLFPPASSVPPRTTEELVDTELVQVMQTVTDDVIEVPLTIVIPDSKLRLEGVEVTQVYVTFDLIDSETNVALDTVVKTLDVSQHLQVYYTPKEPPRVNASPSEVSSRVNLEIKQVDPGATEVQVFKKSFWVASSATDEYSLIGTYGLTSLDQSLLVQVDLPRMSPVIYRIVSRGRQSMQSFEYTNVAVKPNRFSPVKSVSLSAVSMSTGIQLQARSIPPTVVAIQFIRWNLTTFDSSYSTVGGDVGFVDDASRQADLVATIDTDVAPNNTYRYVARLIFRDGNKSDFGDATIEFIQPSPGEVDTRIDSLIVSHDTAPNVAFDITTVTVDTDLDVVKNMIDNLGLGQFFAGDIQAQRDQLKQLIAHSVQRVDLTTGLREDFGILTTTHFDDAALRKNQAIQPLEYGHRYRYEVYPLLRAAETMFDGFRKDAVDQVTKKPYTFSPAKFLHPITLSRGVIVTTAGASQRYAKDPMAYGVIGSNTFTEVSFDLDTAKVIEPTATKFDRYLNVVSWKVLGDIKQVDHFLVMKEVHGIRTLIGKTHSAFTYGSCQYIHPIEDRDVGALKYVVVPVMDDYRLGSPAVTNTVIVEQR